MQCRLATFGQALCGLALFFSVAGCGKAADLSILPVRVHLSASNPIDALTIRNRGGTPTVVQAQTMRWTQSEGRDAYSATREILVSPPIFSVPPGGEQVVRIGLRRQTDGTRELSYRVFLQEVPPPMQPGFKGMRVTVRFSVPVFVEPSRTGSSAATLSAVHWSALQERNVLRLTAGNGSPLHVEFTHLALNVNGDSKPLFSKNVRSYVLPGQSHSWKIDHAFRAGTKVQISAKSDAGIFSTAVLVRDGPN